MGGRGVVRMRRNWQKMAFVGGQEEIGKFASMNNILQFKSAKSRIIIIIYSFEQSSN